MSAAMVMFRIRCPEGEPSVQRIRERFGLAEDEIDAGFGVIRDDERTEAYTILVAETASAKLASGGGWIVEGPFANPRIAPFGPPESDV